MEDFTDVGAPKKSMDKGPSIVRRHRSPLSTRTRGFSESYSRSLEYSHCGPDSTADSDEYDFILPENSLEKQRIINNHLFGFRKWKSHVSTIPIAQRSPTVQSLYTNTYQLVFESTWNVGNILYVVLCGWWVALIYAVVAGIMFASLVGTRYGSFCMMMARYFIWPFGKFIHWNTDTYMRLESIQKRVTRSLTIDVGVSSDSESEPILIGSADHFSSYTEPKPQTSNQLPESQMSDNDLQDIPKPAQTRKFDYKKPESIAWLVIGVPLLGLTHVAAFLVTWIPVIFIPVAKIQGRMLTQMLLLPPDALRVEDTNHSGSSDKTSDIVLYVPHAVNLNYYKYKVDGMNVILVNMLSVVFLALLLGYADPNRSFIQQEVKFSLAMVSIIPLAYYIGMAITSLSAQTLPAIGALLNATFGSIVEIILYITSLVKEGKENTVCYSYLVKASLVGTLLATTLLIPGIAMVIGGLKHSTQRFNSHSTGVSATLLFVSIAVVFAPTIFTYTYRSAHCSHCVNTSTPVGNNSWSFDCSTCYTQTAADFSQTTLYKERVEPLAHACVVVLILAYVIGLVFSLKTHKKQVHDSFVPDLVDGATGSGGHGSPQWGRAKCIVILISATVLMCLCADLVVYNIEPIIDQSHVSINFIGVILLAIVPDIPEIVIGIQFALQNNITMSIDMGCNIATQVCMLQIPVLVLTNLFYPVGFHMLFSEIHIWSVALGVFMMNYTLQDGKSNYFQGSALVLAYVAFICMYFFTPDPPTLKC